MSLSPWLQAVISSTVVVGLGAFFLRHAIAGWVTRQFDKERQAFQHELDKQLEAHKVQLSTASKKHEKAQELEFNTLPRLVTVMQSAVGAVALLVNATWRIVYDLHEQQEDMYLRWVDSLPYHDDDKQKLRTVESAKRNDLYKDLRFMYEKGDAKKKWGEYHNLLLDHAFMLGSLSLPCYKLDNLLNTNIMKCEWEKESHKARIDYDEWNAVHPLTMEISTLVGERLTFPPSPRPGSREATNV